MGHTGPFRFTGWGPAVSRHGPSRCHRALRSQGSSPPPDWTSDAPAPPWPAPLTGRTVWRHEDPHQRRHGRRHRSHLAGRRAAGDPAVGALPVDVHLGRERGRARLLRRRRRRGPGERGPLVDAQSAAGAHGRTGPDADRQAQVAVHGGGHPAR
ncbi:hypothetical protein P376_5792 [Streptomyces sp. HCCB10043]|nr:hypothetical protein P376_5792 [Streptomyces sp. HCCB10043]